MDVFVFEWDVVCSGRPYAGYANSIYSVASSRVNPRQADSIVCPTPYTIARIGDIGKFEALCTKAMVALLTVPPVTGETTPITRIKIEKNRPNLCLRSVTNAITAAPVWITIDENRAHRKTWYHISTNFVNVLVPTPRRPITLAIVSNSEIVSEYIAFAGWDTVLIIPHFPLLLFLRTLDLLISKSPSNACFMC